MSNTHVGEIVTKLWEPYDIPIVTVAGEPGSGKTLWGLLVDSDCLTFNHEPTTYVWDTEGSSAPYVGALNFDRVDIPSALLSKTNGKYEPEDVFLYWRDSMMRVQPKQYRVLFIDTITAIEDGLAQYIKKHPTDYGYTAGQFTKMQGLMWGVVKNEWKRLLLIAAEKCETLVLAAHMKAEWRGKEPTNRRIPRGKETLMEISSVYMTLGRSIKPNATTTSTKPSAICTWPGGKSRLVRLNPKTGQPEQLLPPHIPDATPDGIREYLKVPPDFTKLKPAERAVPTPTLTDDDKLIIQASIAVDGAAKAQAELGKIEAEKELRMEVKQEKVKEGYFNADGLKKLLLGKVSLDEAKVILQMRYGVVKITQLTVKQAVDLESHIATLGN